MSTGGAFNAIPFAVTLTTLRLIFGPVIKMLPVQAGALPDSQPPTPGTEPLSVVTWMWGGSRPESSVKRRRSDGIGNYPSFLCCDCRCQRGSGV